MNIRNKADRSIMFLTLLFISVFTYPVYLLVYETQAFERIISSCKSLGILCFTTLGQSSLLFLAFLLFSAFALMFAVIRKLLSYRAFLKVRRNVVKCLSKPGEIKRLMGREDVEGRKIKVKVIERIEATAFVTGIFNPVVYISQDLIGVLSREEIFAVIVHEYAHFKKLDHFKILFASFLKDIIFFIPLAGFFLKNYLSEKEFNADEGTLENVENEFILAGAILKAMKLRIKPASTKLSFSANFSDELPEKRIEKLMGKKVTRGKMARLIISIILSLAILGFILGTSYRASSEAYIDCCQTGETCGYTEISCCVE